MIHFKKLNKLNFTHSTHPSSFDFGLRASLKMTGEEEKTPVMLPAQRSLSDAWEIVEVLEQADLFFSVRPACPAKPWRSRERYLRGRRSFSEVGSERSESKRDSNGSYLKYGFSFIEVTLTIAIIGMMITSLFSLQFGAFRNVTIEHAILSRVFYLRNIYFDPENFQKLQKDKALTQEIADPKMKMVSKYSEVPEKSEISKKFENIYLVKSTGSWQGMQVEQQEALVTFVYVKPKEEKKTK